MLLKLRIVVLLFVYLQPHALLIAAAGDTLRDNHHVYSFIIQDTPARLFTMRQFDENYLSGYRLFSGMMERNFAPAANYTIQTITCLFAFTPLTHEEGHRSILLSKNIGSISQPFFLSKRGGYINGVSDSSLKNLRNKDLSDYIRLYTSGLESDFMLTFREESLLSFENEAFKSIAVEYLVRKAMMMQYYLMGLIKFNIDGDEESNELKRDIVGNDVYGAIRHLHRPTMPFHRYTRYNDLTPEEITYLKRTGYRSLLNLLNPNIIGIRNFKISGNLQMNAGFGYALCPFGDFIDQHLWLKWNEALRLHAYVREYQNNKSWFMGGGLGIQDYWIGTRFLSSLDLHIWNQPSDLGFNDEKGKPGGAVESVARYFFPTNHHTKLKALSVDLGLTYKTNGYLPEEIFMKQHFGFRLGTSFVF